MTNRLAIDGGSPTRTKALPPNYPGAIVMDNAEASSAGKVILSQSPFRYYGPDVQGAVEAFERTMEEKLGVKYALGVTSGTSALIVAMKALGIGYGDKVIVPANTFIATAGAVICCNAVPVYVDIDETLNLDPAALEAVMDDDVKAIIAVPILGTPCDLDPIMEFAEQHNIYVIEDVAQSCGTTYKGSFAGTRGHVGIFSFQMNKILTAGEGGAVVTNDPVIFERAVRYHDQGIFRQKDRYGIVSPEETHSFIGQNYRMSEITGAVLLEQWKKLDDIVHSMKKHHSRIKKTLGQSLPGIKFRMSPDEEGGIGSNLGIILPLEDSAKRFIKAMAAENISAYTLYGGKPIYMMPQLFNKRTAEADGFPFNYPFKRPVEYTENMCPRAVDLIARSVFIPLSPILTDQDVTEIIEGVLKVYPECIK